MANYRNLQEWKNDLINKITKSLQETANKIYDKWKELVGKEIYSYNSPTYEKTGMLLESIRLSEVKREGDLFYIDIYVENKEHGYVEQWKSDINTYTNIYKMFSWGFHNGEEINPSNEIYESYILTKKWVDILKDMLKEKGIRV